MAAAATTGEGTGVGSALKDALTGFSRVLFAIIVGLGYLLPVLVVAAGIWWIVRRARHRPGLTLN